MPGIKTTILMLLLISFRPAFAQKPVKPPLLDLDGVQAQIFLNSDNYGGWNYMEYGQHTVDGNLDEIGFPTAEFSMIKSKRGFAGLYRLNLCFTPIKRKTAQPDYSKELKIGVSFYRELSNHITYYHTATGINDTVISQTYSYLLQSNELSVDGAFILKTNPENGIAFFAGMGVGAGYAPTSTARAIYLNSYLYSAYDSSCNCDIQHGSLKDEISITKNAMHPVYLNAYIPFGVEFRVINRWRATVEGNSGVAWQLFLNSSNTVRFQYAVGAGLKYYW